MNLRPHSINPYSWILIVFFIALSIVLKMIPHMPNWSPLLVFFLYLGNTLSRSFSMLGIIIITILADIIFSISSNYSLFGNWTFFTYSGFLMMGICGSLYFVSVKKWSFILIAISSSCAFWLWTNLGVWLLSGMYPHSLEGLLHCYLLALPFLKTTLFSSLLWGAVFVSLTRIQWLPSSLKIVTF